MVKLREYFICFCLASPALEFAYTGQLLSPSPDVVVRLQTGYHISVASVYLAVSNRRTIMVLCEADLADSGQQHYHMRFQLL
jgi:hypothetical protein